MAALALVALALRTWPAASYVLDRGRVFFQGNDAWLHVRVAELWARGFPERPTFDSQLLFPGGQAIPLAPLFDLLLLLPVRLLGLSEPAGQLWMAALPAVLGALSVLLVYCLGRAVFSRPAALLGAALVAVQPGTFLAISLFGRADHHVLETDLAFALLLFLALATRASVGGRTRPAVGWSICAGLGLAGYALTWRGGPLLLALLAAEAAIAALLEHRTGCARSAGWPELPHAGILVTGYVALWVWRLVLGRPPWWGALQIGFLGAASTVVLLAALRALARRAGLGAGTWRTSVLVSCALAGIAGLMALQRLAPHLASYLADQLGRFSPSATSRTVGEARPLFDVAEHRSVDLLGTGWQAFRATFFVGLFGGIAAGERWLRRRDRACGQVVLFAVAMLLATLSQARFSYYLAPALALLAAFLTVQALGPLLSAPDQGRVSAARRVLVVLLVGGLLGASASAALRTARQDLTPPKDWRSALDWLRRETPKRAERDLDTAGDGGGRGTSPTAYGVLSWWDYGYWILTLGERSPIANPTQAGARRAARALMAGEPETIERELAKLGARYVVVDPRMAARSGDRGRIGLGLVPAIATWAGIDTDALYERAELLERGRRGEVTLFAPRYYRTLAVRLAAFGNRATPGTGPVWVVELAAKKPGAPRKILSRRVFSSVAEASRALSSGAVRGAIVGIDPLRSPVPIEPLPGLVRRFGGDASVSVFERVAGGPSVAPPQPARGGGPWRSSPSQPLPSRTASKRNRAP